MDCRILRHVTLKADGHLGWVTIVWGITLILDMLRLNQVGTFDKH